MIKLIVTIINWMKSLVTINYHQLIIDVCSTDGIFYLEDYMYLKKVDIEYTTLKIDLNKFVLHLWHQAVEWCKMEINDRLWNIAHDTIQRSIGEMINKPLQTYDIEFTGTLDVVHHGNINDPIVAAKLMLKHQPVEIIEFKKTTKMPKKNRRHYKININSSDIDEVEVLEERLESKTTTRLRKYGCIKKECRCHGLRGRGHDNRKTMKAREIKHAVDMNNNGRFTHTNKYGR